MTTTVLYPTKQVRLNNAVYLLWLTGLFTNVQVAVLGAFWTSWLSVFLYFGLGAFYARAAALVIRARHNDAEYGANMFWLTLWRIVAWPGAQIYDRYVPQVVPEQARMRGPVDRMVTWFQAPLVRNRAKVEEMRSQAQSLEDAVGLSTASEDEKRIMRAAASALRSQADFLDIS